jgi:LysR family hydrogen peroxide-inducible transcriptional activator
MIHLPSLQQLRFLCALAEHRHFARAAAACAVTQSTLSAGIQELEERLGARLIERRKGNLLITPLGEDILERARRLLRDAADLVEVARRGRTPLTGPLQIGVIPTIGPYLVPAIIRRAAVAFPQLQLFWREEQTAALLDRLAGGQLDLALVALPYDLGDLETMALGEDSLVVAMPAGHRLAREETIDRAALAGEPLLLLEDGHCLRSHALEACRLADRDRNEVFQGTSLHTLVQMAASGLGLTLVPRLALGIELGGDTGLVARPLRGAGAARLIALAWRPSSPRKAEFRRFGEAIETVVGTCAGASMPAGRPGD